MHSRWSMLGVAGVVAVEASGNGTWIESPVQADPSYLGNSIPITLPIIIGVQVFIMAFVEQQRSSQTDPVMRMYPGGAFDPAGLSKGADFEQLKRKEIANGRVAMLAFAGIIGAAQANNNEGPVASLTRHLADPWHVNVADNAAAVPYL